MSEEAKEILPPYRYVGYVAASLTTVAFLPQAYDVWKTNDTESLSAATYSIYLIGLVLWMVYGFLDEDYPIAYSSIVSITIATYLLYKIASNSRNYRHR
jgi:MtN3 and saliva related transmembrane protein